MSVVYKTIAEVRFLHEYYLTDSDGSSFFSISDPVRQQEFLRRRFEKEIPTVNELLDFVLPQSGGEYISSPFIRVVPSYGGFRVLTAVKEKNNADETISYLPRHTLPASIGIFLKAKNESIDVVTNLRLRTSISARSFFANYDLTAQKNFPSLCNGVPEHQPGSIYEQGQLASFGTTEVRQFFRNKSGHQWHTIQNGRDFASESDRLLVPLKFTYRFNDNTIIAANFILKSTNGTVIKTISVSGNQPIREAVLDFSASTVSTVPGVVASSQLIYKLEVEGNNSFSHTLPLIFLGQASEYRDCWGFVHLGTVTGNQDYSLLDNDGFLKTKKDTRGNIINTPVFDIRLKSRFTYWRYVNSRRRNLSRIDELEKILEEDGGRLVSLSPKELTYLPGMFRKESSSEFILLPNPEQNAILRNENDRLYSDITVHESPLFPVI
ncbi:MAG: hypothetical protein KF746_20985 [Chitinophagaceae bacterium]|nr:hypothetical protein [Chitinophagaceae bacterium]